MLIAALVAVGSSQAEAEDAADRAEAAAAAAEAALSSIVTTSFATMSAAMAYEPTVAPTYLRIEGYAAVGDGGGALYKKVVSEPSHAGKFSITLDDGVTVVWYEIAETEIFPEMFGAKRDGATDDQPAIQNAINFSRRTFFREGTYLLNSGLTLPTKQQLHGFSASNTDSLSSSGAAKLLFTGGAGGTDACFKNANPAAPLTHGGIFGLSIRCTGQYRWVFDFVETVEWTWSKLAVRATSVTGSGTISSGILRSQKLDPANPSWTNLIEGCKFQIPDDSGSFVMDVDWSDVVVSDTHLTGGRGTLDRGFGTKYIGCNIERSSGAGLTLKKVTNTKSGVVIGCFIDANATYGILIDVQDDTPSAASHKFLAFSIIGNTFRTIDPNTAAQGVADIGFAAGSNTNIYRGATICGNTYNPLSGLQQIAFNPAYFTDINRIGDNTLDDSSTAFALNSGDPQFYAGRRGINVPSGPAVVRGNSTIKNETNAAGFFGTPGTGPGVTLGSKSGVAPFVGASDDNDGNATDLRFYTDQTERVRIHSAGSYMRPASDNAMTLGGASNRWSTVYAGTGTINTSDEREKAKIGPIPDKVLDAWSDVEWFQFRFTSGDRLHTGLIAQRVVDAFAKRGLDAAKYGLLCYDEWPDELEAVFEEVDTDTGGKEFRPTGEVRIIRPGGNRYGIRYEEALAMEAALMRRTMKELRSPS